ERLYQLVQQDRMKDVDKNALRATIEAAAAKGGVQLYRLVPGSQ
ncbi:MAG: hypothetical protein JWP27_1175, partial [Flaviaesturariibacter sp.]|nr:hypothetical protein [Flaviaesturariibacter sp.]